MAGPRGRGREEALQAANQVLLPLLRAARRLTRLYEAYTRRPLRPVHLYSGYSNRIHVFTLDIPDIGTTAIAVYASVQRTRPASPAQVERRIANLARAVKRYAPQARDIIYLYLSKVRLTAAAYREARRRGVFVALDARTAMRLLSRLLAKRLRRLLEKTRSRIWGPPALLAYTLALTARGLGEAISDELLRDLLHKALSRQNREPYM